MRLCLKKAKNMLRPLSFVVPLAIFHQKTHVSFLLHRKEDAAYASRFIIYVCITNFIAYEIRLCLTNKFKYKLHHQKNQSNCCLMPILLSVAYCDPYIHSSVLCISIYILPYLLMDRWMAIAGEGVSGGCGGSKFIDEKMKQKTWGFLCEVYIYRCHAWMKALTSTSMHTYLPILTILYARRTHERCCRLKVATTAPNKWAFLW